MQPSVDYSKITEVTHDFVTKEQVQRSFDRYSWAKNFCIGKNVLEVACGSGQGLGYIAKIAKRFVAGDFSWKVLNVAKNYYDSRIDLLQMDAQYLPFANKSLDVIILFEAIYYVPDAELFIKECGRILRPNGEVLIATANKDLFDFNPSPHTFKYYGVLDLKALFDRNGFSTNFFGNTAVNKLSVLQRVSRPLKKLAVKLNLMPKTADGKKWLKRIIFGKLVEMPGEITDEIFPKTNPTPLNDQNVDKEHKVIYCAAKLLN